jgi:3-phytase
VVVVEKAAVRWRVALSLALLAGAVTVPSVAAQAAAPPSEVSATVETQPVAHSGDAADDVAIWVHPTNASASTVIGTDKLGALHVYDLAGRQLQALPVGEANNIDLRGNLVTFANRTDNTLEIYRVVPGTRRLSDAAARSIATGMQVYGSCMYRSWAGTNYVFVTSTTGEVQQWRLRPTRYGTWDARLVRSFAVGSKAEGCVADDAPGNLYVGQETEGIWRYGADPGDGSTRVLVAATSASGPLVSNVEGLALVRGAAGSGYLIVSSQGNNSFAVYRRKAPHAFVTSFKVVNGNGIDGVTGTDGIDVATAPLGPLFPSGVFIAQDQTNDGGNQNFKLVPYEQLGRLMG